MVRPKPVNLPAPVVRPSPVCMDEYEVLIPQRETVSVDQRGTPRGRSVVATWYTYADDLMQVPVRSHIPKQQLMSPKFSQTRPQQQACPQQQARPQQHTYPQHQAHPRQHQQGVLVNNLESAVSERDVNVMEAVEGLLLLPSWPIKICDKKAGNNDKQPGTGKI